MKKQRSKKSKAKSKSIVSWLKGHHIIVPLLFIIGIGSIGAWRVFMSNAATVNRGTTAYVSTEVGCYLAGRDWNGQCATGESGCRTGASGYTTVLGSDGSRRGYCANAISRDISLSQCTALGRRFVNEVGCSRKLSSGNTVGATQCIYSNNTYYVDGTDRCGLPCNGIIINNIATCPTVSTTTKAAATGIDTSNKDAVNSSYKNLWASGTGISAGWTGSVSTCNAGNTTTQAITVQLNAINFVRQLAGLQQVTSTPFKGTAQTSAQEAALISDANQNPDHSPATTAKCWSQVGADSARRSNLAFGFAQRTPLDAISGYMLEPGAGNESVGHRRWLLFPQSSEFAFGLTSRASAIQVIGLARTNTANPAWVSWPTDGYFPSTLDPNGRWSLSSGSSDASFTNATVKVTHNGVNVPVTKYPLKSYGKPTIVWRMPSTVDSYGNDKATFEKSGRYTVTVSGITGAAASSYTYNVDFFTPY